MTGYSASAMPVGLSRRSMLVRSGVVGSAVFGLPQLLEAEQQRQSRLTGPAKHCIYLFLWGGPSTQDLFDMKPEAPQGIRSVYKPIDTAVPGMQFSELLPSMAQRSDKISLIRSMHHGSNTHHIAINHTLMGKVSPRPAERHTAPHDHPGFGPVLDYLGDATPLPASVTIPRRLFAEGGFYKGPWAGFLGHQYDPFFIEEPKNTRAIKDIQVKTLQPADGLSAARLRKRRALLGSLSPTDGNGAHDLNAPEQQLDTYYEQAFSLLASGKARDAFDLGREPDALRDRYGRNEYGQSFLMARRLIEAGTRLVSVIWMFYGKNGCLSNVWDSHGGTGCVGGVTGFDMLKADYCCPPLDRAYSALLDDLDDRGLLDETLIVAVGEFGRTPKVNKKGGRDHWCHAYSALLAGGGIQGGQIYGATDRHAAYVKDKPVTPDDLGATLYHAFGLPPETAIHDRNNRPFRISDGKPLTVLF